MADKKIIEIVIIFIILIGGVFILGNKTNNSSSSISPNVSSEITNTPSSASTANTKTYTLSDVVNHNSENNCWTVIENKVYDITKFIPQHPGGAAILKACGQDATTLFQGERAHQKNNAADILPRYFIGNLQK